MLKKQLVQLAATTQVHVTHHIFDMKKFTYSIVCSVMRLMPLLLLQKMSLGENQILVLFGVIATFGRWWNNDSMKASLKIQMMVLHLLIRLFYALKYKNSQHSYPWYIHIRRAAEDMEGDTEGL